MTAIALRSLTTMAMAAAAAACVRTDALPPPSARPQFDPLEFFAGRSSGAGTLDVMFAKARPIRVESVGTVRPDGSLILDQHIREGDKPPRMRRWLLKRSSTGRWSGTLTDAAGPVTVTAAGNAATIAYRARSGVHIRQQLRLQPDGHTLFNRLTASKWGIPVATLDETIRKLS